MNDQKAIPCIGGPLDGKVVADVGHLLMAHVHDPMKPFIDTNPNPILSMNTMFKTVEYYMHKFRDMDGSILSMYILAGERSPIARLLMHYTNKETR